MYQTCFVCDVNNVGFLNGFSLFAEDTTLQSGKKITEVLSEILDKPVQETNVHSKIICKKCHKFVSEYDSIQIRMQVIKMDLISHFKATLPRHRLSYDTYNKQAQIIHVPALGTEKKPEPKKLVLPASKLQPVPADFIIRPGKWLATSKTTASKPIVTIPSSTSTLNLKVTVGSSVLTQSIKTTNAIGNKMISLTSNSNTSQNYILAPKSDNDTNNVITEINIDPNTLLQSIEPPINISSLNYSTNSNTSSTPTKTNNSILSFNVKSFPKDFLSSAVFNKVDVNDLVEFEVDLKKEIQDGDTENNDEQPMEIDEDCSLTVGVSSAEEKEFTQDSEQGESDKSKDFFDNLLPGLESNEYSNDGDIENKYIVGKLEILNGRDNGVDGTTIVMDDENGSIIRLVSGQKFLYGDSEISLVVPEDSQEGDNDNGGQDSNDESQIELRVSGDEETANAIIAAAQEQGGAFIKVESGEMYRVKSVQSKKTVHAVPSIDFQTTLNSMVKQEENGQFKCLLCENNEKIEQSFTGDAPSTMQHLKHEHSARVYICATCGLVGRKRNEYAAHLETHATKPSNGLQLSDKSKIHECTMCNKKYSSRTLLSEHMNLHNGAKPYSCNICNKSFASKYTHQSHLKIHMERTRPFKCKQCAKSFFTLQNLNQHEKTHSGVKDFICNTCGKAFASQHNLEVHGVVHSGSKPFVCSGCGKAFARRAELRDHMRIHTGERPYSCDICGASFTQRSNLHSHKRATHMDDKRYQCTQCPKKFKRRRLLDYHVKATHTGERPLKCEICTSTFVYPEHYKKHIRIHSGEKPYICEVCGKSFNSRDNRNTHRFVHSDRKPYECFVCGAGYMRKQLLYQHMNTTGHIAESIVVNQPRVVKTPKISLPIQSVMVESVSDKIDQYAEGMYDATEELQLQASDCNVATEPNTTTKLFITEDKKIIIQDGKSINIVQDTNDETMFALQNTDTSFKADGTMLEGITAEQLEQVQLMTADGSTGSLRLVQIQLSDGNNGWLAINQ